MICKQPLHGLKISYAGVSPVLKALGSQASLSTCPGNNLNLPEVPSRCEGAMDLRDLEFELRREPEWTQSLTGKLVEGEQKGSMAYNVYCHHDFNQNLEPAVWQGSRPSHKASCIDEFPGRKHQQYAKVGYQQSSGSSCQPSLGCYHLAPGSNFQPSSYHQTQGNRLHGMPMFRMANHLPSGSPGAGSHQQPDHATTFLPMSAQGSWLP